MALYQRNPGLCIVEARQSFHVGPAGLESRHKAPQGNLGLGQFLIFQDTGHLTRKPALKTYKVANVQELQPFFNSVSSIVFSNTYSRLPPDVLDIENLIIRDFQNDHSDVSPRPHPAELVEHSGTVSPSSPTFIEDGFLFQH